MAQSNGPLSSQTMAPPQPARRIGIAWHAAALLVAPLLLIVLGWGTVRAGVRLPGALGPTPGTVYTAIVLQQRLAHHPADWLGRTVLVRGQAEPCPGDYAGHGPPCTYWQPSLQEPGPAGASAYLPLMWESATPLLVFLRRMPLLGGLAPSRQVVRWGAIATYRVQLQALAGSACGTAPCYEALLLDAAP